MAAAAGYVKEPSTNGEVHLYTSAGVLHVGLWSKEAPKACRNFVQNCMEHYYDNTIFHRVIKDFMVQTGDPTGTGNTCESVFGKPYATERHGRLQYRGRGMLGVANAGKNTDTNGSQFFITLGPCRDLNGIHTIFAKLTGTSVYNLMKIAEVETNPRTDRPLDPPYIERVEVVYNPFDDIDIRFDVMEKNKRRAAESRPQKEEEDIKRKRNANAGSQTIGRKALGENEYGDKSVPIAPKKNKAVMSFGADDSDEDDDDANFAPLGKKIMAIHEANPKKKKKNKKTDRHEDVHPSDGDLPTKSHGAVANGVISGTGVSSSSTSAGPREDDTKREREYSHDRDDRKDRNDSSSKPQQDSSSSRQQAITSTTEDLRRRGGVTAGGKKRFKDESSGSSESESDQKKKQNKKKLREVGRKDSSGSDSEDSDAERAYEKARKLQYASKEDQHARDQQAKIDALMNEIRDGTTKEEKKKKQKKQKLSDQLLDGYKRGKKKQKGGSRLETLKNFSNRLANLKRERTDLDGDGETETFALTGGLKFQVTGNRAYEIAEAKERREEAAKWKGKSALDLLSQARPESLR